MKKKVISLLLCCTLIVQPGISVYGEALLSSGEETMSEEATESNEALDDGAAEAPVPENAPGEETTEQTVSGEAAEFTLEAPAEDIGSEGTEKENTGEENTSSGQCGENVFWELDENGVLTIRADGEGEMYSYEQGKSPFYGNLDIKSVIIEEGTGNTIGSYFFESCKNIEKVTFSENILDIEEYAFANCWGLKDIILPNTWGLQKGAFSGCINLESIDMPNSMRRLGEYAFEGCRSLMTITIPAKVETIPERAFSDCKNLKNVVVSSGVKEILDYAFADCNSLKNVTIPRGTTFIAGTAFSRTGEIKISGVEGSYAEKYAKENDIVFEALDKEIVESGKYGENLTWTLDKNGHLTISGQGEMQNIDDTSDPNNLIFEKDRIRTVKIEEGITSIGKNAFSMCYNLVRIDIPESVINIEEMAFSLCDSLESIKIPNSVERIGDNAFTGCHHLGDFDGKMERVLIPDSVKYIGKNAFSDCGFNAVTLPKNINVIEEGVFSGCYSLNFIEIPDNVKSIKPNAFSGCTSVMYIDLPNGLKSIGERAFAGCIYNLHSVYIPSSVTSIGTEAFEGAEDLKILGEIGSYAEQYANANKIPFQTLDTNGKLGENVTWTLDENGRLTISGTGDMYVDYGGKAPFYQNPDIKSIKIEEGVRNISGYTFEECSNLTSVEISGSVKEIGTEAFLNCSSLKEIKIADGVERILPSAFAGCSSLKNIVIPDSVTNLESSLFENCYSLESVSLPNNAGQVINYGMFRNCKKLSDIKIPDNNHWILSMAFEGCSSLTDITIPENVTTIDERAFMDCSSLTNIVIPNSVEKIGKNVFKGCENLTNITLPDRITKIEEETFLDCHSLESIVIPDNVTSIGAYAFYDCKALSSIKLPDGITTIGTCAFNTLGNSLERVTLPKSVKSIGSRAFSSAREIHGYAGSEAEQYVKNEGNPDQIFTEHDWLWENSATCTQDGENRKICSICDLVEDTEIIPALGHKWGEGVIETEPSCTTEGTKVYLCEREGCNATKTETIPATEHNWQWNTNSATCIQSGERTKHCTICGLVEESETIPALGHKWGEGVIEVAPTCTIEGKAVYKCERCSATKTETLPVMEHEYEKVTEKASFGKEGSISEKCKTCGEEKEKTIIPAVLPIRLSETEFSYNGTNRQPKVTVTDSKGNAVPFSVSYPAESKKPGTYSVTVTLTGENYEGSASASYVITKGKQVLEFNDVSKRIDSKTATLKAVIVQGNKTAKIKYSSDNPKVVTISANGKAMLHRVGTARITATVKESENYEGVSKTITLTVLPAPTAVTKLQSQKPGWLNIQYRANGEADGYQMQYGTSADMKGAKYAAVNTPKIRSYTRKDVISGKTYYVRVRTFNVVDGKRVYSNWSGIKKAFVK